MRDLRQPNLKFQISILANAIDVLSDRLTGPQADNPSLFLQQEAIVALDECRSALSAITDIADHHPIQHTATPLRKSA